MEAATFFIQLVSILIAARIAGGYLLVREHWLTRSAVGMAMVPRGEVGLIFAELGRAAGILNGETYAAMVLVIVCTTLFSPFWSKHFYRLYGTRSALVETQVEIRPAILSPNP